MAYIPNCNDPAIRAQLPSLICDGTYPPEVIAQICERQPSLCQPYPEAQAPSIYDPIWGTVTKVVEPFGKVWDASGKVVEAAGSATLGGGKTILALDTIIPLALIVAGIYLIKSK